MKQILRKCLDHIPVRPDISKRLFDDHINNKGVNILFVDYEVPRYDMFAGSRADYLYLKLLVGLGHNVKLLPADFRGVEPYTTEYEGMGIDVIHGAWFKKNWRQWISEIAGSLDVVFFNKPDPTTLFIEYIRQNTNARILYQMHDLHYLRLKRKYEVEKDKNIINIAAMYKEKEFDIFSKSDVILTFSSKEKEILEHDIPGKKIVVLPLFFHENISDRIMMSEIREGILFVGSFGHSPNTDAVRWFVQNILPKVIREIPDIIFYVVGGNPPRDIKNLLPENIRYMGHMSDDDLVNMYNKVRLVVIPLRYGAGVKGKTIEAMFHGVPIVSTSIGIEGIDGIHEIIQPTDDPAEFSNEIVKYYNDVKLLMSKSEELRMFAGQKFNHAIAADLIDKIVRLR